MKFDNTGGLAYEKNTKCDGAEIFHRCETYFEICLQPGSDQPTNFSNCWYYLNTSRTYIWKDNIDFQYNKVGVPKTIKLKINQSWPGVRLSHVTRTRQVKNGPVETLQLL